MTRDRSRTWFITGASRGLGRAFAEAALAAGDRVVGVARDTTPLDDLVAESGGRLVTFPLDVSDRHAVLAGVQRAFAAFGGLDVVVNNAGGALLGMVEEVTEEQARAHLDTNFFGALWVNQAVVPLLRSQGSGYIVQVSSMGSAGGFAATGLYSAGKAALDAMSEALAMEVERFGIKVTILQPGGYRTDLFTLGLTTTGEDPAYAPLRAWLNELWGESEDFDPRLAASVLLRVVDLPEPPKRLVLGGAAYGMVEEMARARTAELAKWEHLSRQAG
ncbi:SDR family NAD(P)-dependent oxidoreductase [Saccharothrix texasensis]|uniref:NADP-dependent 3-hydroxy acid dehydrogenase YdfG n=1 Tax=Saccharothrix texasensis TaxID=103734 RepID=A0A3N1HIU3_9PSEU|nr:SDR family NAD(P)-dependent oxidoreductase [Saccharothrix texasensis]ROP42453.1 NADP-dependent 3-hydroxy acid dehydrogenase YdfG [Saccharothrix texasensis]